MKKDTLSTRRRKAMKSPPKPKKLKGNPWNCSYCQERLSRVSVIVQMHLHNVHNIVASTAEVHRLLAPKGFRGIPYAEGLKRNWRLVSGGLPSLGKKR